VLVTPERPARGAPWCRQSQAPAAPKDSPRYELHQRYALAPLSHGIPG
jgi:hypothetical protein